MFFHYIDFVELFDQFIKAIKKQLKSACKINIYFMFNSDSSPCDYKDIWINYLQVNIKSRKTLLPSPCIFVFIYRVFLGIA